MHIFSLELKKIITSPAVWGFMLVCAAFNLFVFFGNGTIPRADDAPINVFEGYRTEYIAEAYIDALGVDGGIAADIRAKYAALQTVVEEKARSGDSLGQYTEWQHKSIFGMTMKHLLFEGGVHALLITLLSLGYENINHTEQSVYSSKTGRYIIRHKLCVSLVAGLGAYVVLVAISIVPLYIGYLDIWKGNVSSAFNYYYDLIAGERPFATWRSFTVGGYLWAVIAVSAGVVVCCCLAAFAVGATIRNSYAAFLALLLVIVASAFIPMMLPMDTYVPYAFMYTPVWLFLKLHIWFTDGGMDILWRNYETWGAGLSLAGLSVCAALTAYRFNRRDIV